MKKNTYAIVGTGARVVMFLDPIVGKYRDCAQLVALCDNSLTRMNFHLQRIARDYGAPTVATYLAADFDQMLREQKPDVVIVCTPDAFHHDYLIRALNQGCEVICEKPLTTDAAKCAAILEAVERTGKKVRTTFNARWIPGPTKVREMISSGRIGNVKQVNFEYFLNTSHGADYFRRWHSDKCISGGLLVHKSTHHFDLLNWWIDAIPSRVFAYGDLAFYGEENAISRGQTELTGYPRYTGIPEAKNDPFRMDLAGDDRLNALYHEAEAESGYIRDRNVFRKNISIEDVMSVLIKYRSGVIASYSLNAFSPIEGMNLTICGDAGRLEYLERKSAQALDADGKLTVDTSEGYRMELRITPLFSPTYEVPIEIGAGSHGGSDAIIQEQIFSPTPSPDVWGRNAGHEQGCASLLIGAAANESIRTGREIQLDELLPLRPDATRFSDLI